MKNKTIFVCLFEKDREKQDVGFGHSWLNAENCIRRVVFQLNILRVFGLAWQI